MPVPGLTQTVAVPMASGSPAGTSFVPRRVVLNGLPPASTGAASSDAMSSAAMTTKGRTIRRWSMLGLLFLILGLGRDRDQPRVARLVVKRLVLAGSIWLA